MMTNWTIKKKLMALITIPLFLFSMLSLYQYERMTSASTDLGMLYQRNFHSLELVGQIDGLLTRVDINILRMIAIGDPASIENWKQENNDRFNKVDGLIEQLSAQQDSSASRELVNLTSSYQKMRSGMLHQVQLIEAGDIKGGTEVNRLEVRENANQVFGALQQMKDIESASAATRFHAQERAAAASVIIMIGTYLLCLALSIGLGSVVSGGINTSMKIAISKLTQGASQIAAAASQVAASSQSLAQGASEQAATIEETSSASMEIHSMAERNAENSNNTAEIVRRSESEFLKTNQSLDQMIVAMEDISGSSQKISKIIKVIDDIAFQTNILALNAAVEAARAGEAGMGFAVVADEVRNLAQRCAKAAKETADLIEESIQKSNGGSVKVGEVASAIRAITAESGKIKILVEEISQGSSEQSRGLSQISTAITQMEQVTQSSAANAEEGAAAAEELNAQAQSLQEVVVRLQSLVNAEQTHSFDHPHRPLGPGRRSTLPKSQQLGTSMFDAA
jgi:methyl-accepting chemotaxis protein